MQSSMWANSSSAVSQYQQQQQQQQQQTTQQHQHQYQQEALSAPHGDVCPHLKVMRRGTDNVDSGASRRPPSAARVWSPQPQSPSPQPLPPPPQFTSRSVGLLPSSSSNAIIQEDEAATAAAAATAASADAASFPLLSINDSLREAARPSVAVPLVTRQQRYLQQHRLLLLSQQPPPQLPDLSLGPGAEAALRLKLQRKRIRYRALILIYLSCMLLFVLAVVFLAALGVFHTAEVSGKEHHHE